MRLVAFANMVVSFKTRNVSFCRTARRNLRRLRCLLLSIEAIWSEIDRRVSSLCCSAGDQCCAVSVPPAGPLDISWMTPPLYLAFRTYVLHMVELIRATVTRTIESAVTYEVCDLIPCPLYVGQAAVSVVYDDKVHQRPRLPYPEKDLRP